MAISPTRACSACHSAKVKCVKVEGKAVCNRCERIGLKCVEHASRQGQGTRRRKKVKSKAMQSEDDTVDECLAITSALTPMCSNMNNIMGVNLGAMQPSCPTSGANIIGQDPPMCNALNNAANNISDSSNGSSNEKSDGLCNGMASLEIEDNFICKTIIQGMGKDHYGLNCIIRQWVALAFSRRSFSLLARASFIATKMGISMDDILSNQSPFAAATDSQPMDFLSTDILLPKSERKTLGYPVDLREIPWDLLEAVQIDPNRPYETVGNRWSTIRWSSHGCARFWASPLFGRDFATVEEIGKVWDENNDDKEVVDLFLPKSEKGKFAQEVFNMIFLNKKPNTPCFVTKTRFIVQKRNSIEPIEVDVIQTVKLIDLDSNVHYFEIQFLDRTPEHLVGNKTSSANKRDNFDDYLDDVNDDPIMGDGIAFTDIAMTDEMEEFLRLLGGE